MNGQMIGRRQIRTNWAVHRFDGGEDNVMKPTTYDNIFNATHAANTSVYVGGISSSTTGKFCYAGHLLMYCKLCRLNLCIILSQICYQ